MGTRRNGFSTVNPQPCVHISDYRRKRGSDCYNSVQGSIRTAPNGVPHLWKVKSPTPICRICFRTCGRMYSCLMCSSIYCFEHTGSHSGAEAGHEIYVDVERAELFCSACRDQIYDPEFDSLVLGKLQIRGVRWWREEGFVRKREEVEKERGPSKAMLLLAGAKNKSRFPWGLRGLSNLGNTCFMNSVLQVLLHTPPLRNYFLGDGHKRENCCRRMTRKRSSSGEMPCLACDIDALFSAVFSGDRKPYSPARFLYR